jgi:hypothetical protein
MSLGEVQGGYARPMTNHPNAARLRALTAAALLGLGTLGVAACSDEDGDGGTTDEEIQDLEDTGDSIEDQIQEEVDSQDKGTNEDNE